MHDPQRFGGKTPCAARSWRAEGEKPQPPFVQRPHCSYILWWWRWTRPWINRRDPVAVAMDSSWNGPLWINRRGAKRRSISYSTCILHLALTALSKPSNCVGPARLCLPILSLPKSADTEISMSAPGRKIPTNHVDSWPQESPCGDIRYINMHRFLTILVPFGRP